MFADGAFLDGNYTVFGKVRSGMDCVDQINKGEPPANPDKIERLKVQKDIK
jgi:peptidylprolyl isomerase